MTATFPDLAKMLDAGLRAALCVRENGGVTGADVLRSFDALAPGE